MDQSEFQQGYDAGYAAGKLDALASSVDRSDDHLVVDEGEAEEFGVEVGTRGRLIRTVHDEIVGFLPHD